MKKIFSIGLLFILACCPGVLHAETLSVVTRENAVRADCSFLSAVKSKLNYGDKLEVVSRDGDWVKVRYKNIKGCIHKSAVTEQKVSLSGVKASKSSSASEEEVALAGKGFNPQVEDSYKRKHSELDFTKVDRIEKFKIPEDELIIFIKNGGLDQP
jgi:uncharacterized protein YgiM (DUF1202 family)